MKNTFTFPHDFGARNDPALQDIIFEYGPAAGFAYWVLIEMLYEQGGKLPRSSYAQAAYQAHVDIDMIRSIVENGTLFKGDKKFFWSERVLFTLETKEDKASKSRTAAQAKWTKWKKDKELKESADAESMRTQSESKADAMPNNNNSNNNSNSNNIDSSLHSESCANKNDDTDSLFDTCEQIEPSLSPDEILNLWNLGCGKCKKVLRLTDNRREQIKRRVLEFGKTRAEQAQTFNKILENIRGSEFLQFKWENFCFDWVMKNQDNWVKIYEGNYKKENMMAGVKDIRDIKNIDEAIWDRH